MSIGYSGLESYIGVQLPVDQLVSAKHEVMMLVFSLGQRIANIRYTTKYTIDTKQLSERMDNEYH